MISKIRRMVCEMGTDFVTFLNEWAARIESFRARMEGRED